ncbi:hypothetical protein NPIL_394451 [Nephila pilipes]|uniref:Uncharacterized protein n=1 Tax=Nephila pilipes TaxID=299642 RepID=A0A8X6MXT2_NEPPI|nr:hypothetical protein NPIL_394451 [Nephila pilipes]
MQFLLLSLELVQFLEGEVHKLRRCLLSIPEAMKVFQELPSGSESKNSNSSDTEVYSNEPLELIESGAEDDASDDVAISLPGPSR